MASKASKLQGGVKSASKGLFAGMQRLDEQNKKESKATTEVKEAAKPEPKKEVEAVKADTKAESIKEVEKVIEKPAPVEPVKSEPQPQAPIQNTAPAQSTVTVQTPVQEQPQIQPQVPVQAAPQPQMPAYAQPVQPQAYQQPVYSPYTQPVNAAPQMAYTQPVQAPVYNEPKRAEKAEKGEKNSRYEKDKFLLLDIRGLRDYVEHMAKASNMSATKYIRSLIEKDWAANNDIYMAHKALEEQLRQKNNMR